ncbi:hypothetical protein J2Z37_003011 [Ammoniphilus resinae]|uniref:Uncharacterized protein n=1 Tax=Ammoniphilus resinae TaxID=861532 RepID=A0ABS4GRU7_9BACL|nr:hypothetical protein [Ammoniphilus resinae]
MIHGGEAVKKTASSAIENNSSGMTTRKAENSFRGKQISSLVTEVNEKCDHSHRSFQTLPL